VSVQFPSPDHFSIYRDLIRSDLCYNLLHQSCSMLRNVVNMLHPFQGANVMLEYNIN